MYLYVILLLSIYLSNFENKIISTFKPMKIETDNDITTDEYIFTIDNKNHHIILTESELNDYSTSVSIDGKPYKKIFHKKGTFMKGKVANDNNSTIFFYMKKGISGLIVVGNNTFEIKPLKKSNKMRQINKNRTYFLNNEFDHLVIHYDSKENKNFICGNIDEHPSFSDYRKMKYYDPHFSYDHNARGTTRILGLSVVVSFEIFMDKRWGGGNVERTIDSVLLQSQAMNYYFVAVNMLVLTGHIEILTDHSRLAETKPPLGIIDIRNAGYPIRDEFISKGIGFCVTVIFSNYGDANKLGIASEFSFGTERSVIVAVVVDLVTTAVIMSHEVGHNLGILHYDIYSEAMCTCVKVCIMFPSLPSGKNLDYFSWNECDYYRFKRYANDPCLIPGKNFKPLEKKYCGNNIIDSGEECDCGFPSDCKANKIDTYCDPYSCKYYPGYNCTEGICCNNGKIEPMNTQCHSTLDECTIEYCDGTPINCVLKGYAKNGTRCNNQRDMCYNGKCIEYGSICTAEYGNVAELGNANCHSYFNRRTDKSGNCGYDEKHQTFIPCDADDYLCGKLVCKTGVTTHRKDKYTYEANNEGCTVKYISNVENDFQNIWMVNDGITCAADKTCLFHKCLSSDEAIKYKLNRCDDGICCKNFQIEPINTPCHPNSNECEIGYCTGAADICKFANNAPNGTKCNNQGDMCYDGKCIEYGSKCATIFGNSAELGNDKCYSYFNSRNDKSGNCGYNEKIKKFIPCEIADYHCGKLVCRTSLINHAESIYTYEVNPDGCTVRYLSNIEKDFKNIDMVNDGILCAENKTCVLNKCLSTDEFDKYKIKIVCGEFAHLSKIGECACSDSYDNIEGLCFLKLPSSKIIPIIIIIFGIIQVYILAINVYRISRKSTSKIYQMRFSKIDNN